MCGEFFASAEDYQVKLRKENEWAEAWFKWSEERKYEGMEIEQEETEKVIADHELEEISAEDEIEQIAVAE